MCEELPEPPEAISSSCTTLSILFWLFKYIGLIFLLEPRAPLLGTSDLYSSSSLSVILLYRTLFGLLRDPFLTLSFLFPMDAPSLNPPASYWISTTEGLCFILRNPSFLGSWSGSNDLSSMLANSFYSDLDGCSLSDGFLPELAILIWCLFDRFEMPAWSLSS